MASALDAGFLRRATARYFHRRRTLALSTKLALAAGFAVITGISARITIPLGFTDVPLTGQVFAVLLAGLVLGGTYGATSQLFYLAGGALGIPWFAGGSSGLPLGHTGGFIIGFVFAAYLVGALTTRCERLRTFPGQMLAMTLGILVIYAFGAAQYALVRGTGPLQTLMFTVYPFIGVDLAKAFLAAAVARTIMPRELPR